MSNLTLRGLASFASSLDGNGQADLADRMDVLIRTAQFDPEGIMDPESGMAGFDPESDTWRAPLQTRLHWRKPDRWGRKRGEEPTLIRPHQLRSDPDWVSPGERPWHVGEGIEGGNFPGEFDVVSPGYHHMDPDAPSHSYSIDRDEIMDRLFEEAGEVSGIQADSIPELMSKLVHMQYVTLKYDGDEEQMQADHDAGVPYDQEILKRAIADVDAWVSSKFEQIEQDMQENFEEPGDPRDEWDYPENM